MLELPNDPNLLKLADWLEVYALLSPDHNSSQGDLDSALRVAAFAELNDSDAIERRALEVFDELEQRVRAAKQAYPFEIGYGVLRLKSVWEEFPVYTFCLCLSYFGSEDVKPRQLFERVSCLAAKRYLQGDAIGFGHPRTELPSPFPDAITGLCNLIGEGGGFKDQPSLARKDDKLDLVAWKDFCDKRPSKVLLFGQCASGWHWENKLGELHPEAFWDNWMENANISPTPIRSFFIPHRIERDKWEYIARYTGILFDRCRIAFWAHQEATDYSLHLEWTKESLVQAVL